MVKHKNCWSLQNIRKPIPFWFRSIPLSHLHNSCCESNSIDRVFRVFANLNCIVGTKLKNKKYFKFSWWSIIRWLTRNQFFSLCVLGSADGKPVSYTWVLPSICAEIPTSKYHYFILHSWIPHRHLFIIAAYRWRPLTRTGNPGCEFETILRKTLQKLWTNS